MMAKKLKRKFFSQSTLKVAKNLLGKFLVRKINNHKLSGKIVEVEAYHGFNDRASHAFRGKTSRNEVMFGQAGFSYIYLVYGINHCLNFVTGKKNFPAAVLIRAVEPTEGIELMKKFRKNKHFKDLTSGPGKLCQAFNIDRQLNICDITKSKDLWIEDRGEKINPRDIHTAKRIGIDYAGEYWSKIKWRFFLKNNKGY